LDMFEEYRKIYEEREGIKFTEKISINYISIRKSNHV
jgi:hypothetical protein